MVKDKSSRNRNAPHNAITVPLQLVSPMIAACRFEFDEHKERLRIRQVRAFASKEQPLHKPIDKQINPFTLRQRFWQAQGGRAMLQFLNDTGIPWSNEARFYLQDVLQFREFTRIAITKPVSSWQNLPAGEVPKGHVRVGGIWYADATASLSPILCEESGDGFALRLRYANLKQAILASIVIDKIQKTTYRRCKMPGCGMPFEVGVRKKKQYCSEAHRQSEAMRRSRKRRKGNKR